MTQDTSLTVLGDNRQNNKLYALAKNSSFGILKLIEIDLNSLRCQSININSVNPEFVSSFKVSQKSQGAYLKFKEFLKSETRLMWIPTNGKPPIIVDSPLIPSSNVDVISFSLDENYLLYSGEQINAGEKNIFFWKIPNQ